MSALQKFKTFFSKNVLLCLTVPMVVFSLLVPQPFVWMGQNISIDLSGIPFLKENFPSFGFVNMLLCVIMFGMGMTLKADDFKYILKKPTRCAYRHLQPVRLHGRLRLACRIAAVPHGCG